MKGLSIGLGMLLSSVAFASHEIAISQEQMDRLGIALGPIAPAQSLTTDRLPSQVVIPPQQERVVSAPQSGLVTELRAAVGDQVTAGQVLATMDSPELVALQRDFLQAGTQTHLAQTQLQRDRRLVDEGIIAERRYLETRSRYEEAAAGLEQRRQALTLAGMNADAIKELQRSRKLSSTLEVTAPIDGVILEQRVVVGQRLNPAEPLYRIGQLEPLWLEIRVPVDRLSGIAPGTEVQIAPCPDASARVTVIGKNVDRESQSVLVRASVESANGCLRPGQFLQVSLRLASETAHFKVAQSAVIRSGERSFVFVHEPNGFAPVPVEVIGQDAGYAVVSGALNADLQIAVSGLAAIKAAWLGMGGE